MKFHLSCLLVGMMPVCFAQTGDVVPQPASSSVSVTIGMRNTTSLEVSYQIPPSCTALEFRNEGFRPDIASSLRSDWQAADNCTEFDGKQVRRKMHTCNTLRLRVPATARHVDRVYPWAYPVEHGLYAHTAAYAVKNACGPVDWNFVVPNGTVVVDGVMMAERGGRSAVEGGGDELPTVLIQNRFQPGKATRVHASSEFTPATRAVLGRTVASIEAELKEMLPGLSFSVPFIVASPSEPGTYWGDVARRTVMRLSFPSKAGPEQEQLLHSFVTHEMAHLTHPSDWADSWQEDAATVREGSAEFLRVVTASRLGWIDRSGLQDELEKAVNSCLIAAEGKPWKMMRDRNWGMNPYNCGLTFYMIGLASHPGPTTPLLRLRDYFSKAAKRERTDFAHAVECGTQTACNSRWLSRLAGDEPLEAVLLDYTRQPGSLLKATSDWGGVLVKPIAFHHLGMLMRADCQGGISMYREAAAARIADGPRCGTLRPGMVVITAEGLPLFDNSAAVQASIQACRNQGRTVLGLRDGSSVNVACGTSASLPAHLYSVNVDRALYLTK